MLDTLRQQTGGNSGAQNQPAHQRFQVTVPNGVSAGQQFDMQLSNGRRVRVTCPAGVRAGQAVYVNVPASALGPVRPQRPSQNANSGGSGNSASDASSNVDVIEAMAAALDTQDGDSAFVRRLGDDGKLHWAKAVPSDGNDGVVAEADAVAESSIEDMGLVRQFSSGGTLSLVPAQ